MRAERRDARIAAAKAEGRKPHRPPPVEWWVSFSKTAREAKNPRRRFRRSTEEVQLADGSVVRMCDLTGRQWRRLRKAAQRARKALASLPPTPAPEVAA